MCLAIPGQIVELLAEQPMLAKVSVSGVRRNVNIGLLEESASLGRATGCSSTSVLR